MKISKMPLNMGAFSIVRCGQLVHRLAERTQSIPMPEKRNALLFFLTMCAIFDSVSGNYRKRFRKAMKDNDFC